MTRIGAFVDRAGATGFYSQEEVKEIVSYAADLGITVVPEIDMPGHAEAALNSYPRLGCFNIPVKVPQSGFTQNIFARAKTVHSPSCRMYWTKCAGCFRPLISISEAMRLLRKLG